MSNLIFKFTRGFTNRAICLDYNKFTSDTAVILSEKDREGIKEKIFKNAARVYDNLHLVETHILIREENKHKAGVYILYNKINDKFYVGSAISNRIYARFRNHCFHGTGSAVTKRAICKFGAENFYFIVYEYFPGIIKKDNLKSENLKLLARESAIISEFSPEYNILKFAGCNSSVYKHSEESPSFLPFSFTPELREFIGNFKGNKATQTPSIRQNMSERRIQFYIDNPEHIEYLRKFASKPVALYNLEGELINSYPGIRVLCKELGTSNKTINKAIKNNTPVKKKYIVKYI
jgi:group I intron endonuclease